MPLYEIGKPSLASRIVRDDDDEGHPRWWSGIRGRTSVRDDGLCRSYCDGCEERSGGLAQTVSNGPIRAAPAVWAGRVFVVTTNNEIFALAADDGRVLWTYSGLSEVAGLVGAATPAVDSGVVVVPYSSGEVAALRVENGRQVWIESLTALRRSDAVTANSHIRGRPVIDRGIVYIVGNSNRMAAVDLRTGIRLWEVPIGGRNGAWVAGDFIYVMTRNAELVCLTRRGGVRWIAQLPRFEDEEDQEGPVLWSGPVLAGDRLLVGSTQKKYGPYPRTPGRYLAASRCRDLC